MGPPISPSRLTIAVSLSFCRNWSIALSRPVFSRRRTTHNARDEFIWKSLLDFSPLECNGHGLHVCLDVFRQEVMLEGVFFLHTRCCRCCRSPAYHFVAPVSASQGPLQCCSFRSNCQSCCFPQQVTVLPPSHHQDYLCMSSSLSLSHVRQRIIW